MFNLGKALITLGQAELKGEAEILGSAQGLIATINNIISNIEAQPAEISADIAKQHDAILSGIASMCQQHLRKSPVQKEPAPTPLAEGTGNLSQNGAASTTLLQSGSNTTALQQANGGGGSSGDSLGETSGQTAAQSSTSSTSQVSSGGGVGSGVTSQTAGAIGSMIG